MDIEKKRLYSIILEIGLGLNEIENLFASMRVIMLDISGKVLNYDLALVDALKKKSVDTNVEFFAPGRDLLSLIPRRWQHSNNTVKRFIKVGEGLLNYFIVSSKLVFKKPDVLHFQWLPFMEVVGWEIAIIKFIKWLSPKTRLVHTIHNIYPHNMSSERKKAYNARFRKVSSLFDAFIVHTKISKEDVIREFGLSAEKVHVCCHGVFEPKGVTISSKFRKDGKLHILQFGGQSYYKGTDLLVDAVCSLDDERKKRIETHIVGGISQSFLDELKKKDVDSIITWRAIFLSDEELYQEINAADLIVLPYRAISQSGVLLLSIYFGKLIVCSDLPSFKETMQGDEGDILDGCLFFKNEDAGSLRELLVKYVDGIIDEKAVRERINHLKSLYSWESAARATIETYKH